MKTINTLILIILFSTTLAQAQETITLRTYYPSPFGAFTRMRLVPQPAEPVACTGANLGSLYIEDTNNTLQICADSANWSVISGAWTEDGNDIFPTNFATASVGIGKNNPATILDIQNLTNPTITITDTSISTESLTLSNEDDTSRIRTTAADFVIENTNAGGDGNVNITAADEITLTAADDFTINTGGTDRIVIDHGANLITFDGSDVFINNGVLTIGDAGSDEDRTIAFVNGFGIFTIQYDAPTDGTEGNNVLRIYFNNGGGDVEIMSTDGNGNLTIQGNLQVQAAPATGDLQVQPSGVGTDEEGYYATYGP